MQTSHLSFILSSCQRFGAIDPLFNKNAKEQQMVFGGRLFDNPSYEGFFRTDREGRPKGIIALDPKDLINIRS
jgi:hypothetical protein